MESSSKTSRKIKFKNFKKPSTNQASKTPKNSTQNPSNTKNLSRTRKTFKELKEQQIRSKLKARDSLWILFDPSSKQCREDFMFESRLRLHKLWNEELIKKTESWDHSFAKNKNRELYSFIHICETFSIVWFSNLIFCVRLETTYLTSFFFLLKIC